LWRWKWRVNAMRPRSFALRLSYEMQYPCSAVVDTQACSIQFPLWDLQRWRSPSCLPWYEYPLMPYSRSCPWAGCYQVSHESRRRTAPRIGLWLWTRWTLTAYAYFRSHWRWSRRLVAQYRSTRALGQLYYQCPLYAFCLSLSSHTPELSRCNHWSSPKWDCASILRKFPPTRTVNGRRGRTEMN